MESLIQSSRFLESIYYILCWVGCNLEQKLRRNTTLGDNLRRLRKAAGLTQAMAVAQLQLLGFDISREILSQMENGRYNVPVSLLKALKQIYKVPSYDDFFQGI